MPATQLKLPPGLLAMRNSWDCDSLLPELTRATSGSAIPKVPNKRVSSPTPLDFVFQLPVIEVSVVLPKS